jgi:lipoate---protein ligase
MAGTAHAAWRLIDSGLVSPARSAATDEAILNARIRRAVPDTLHFYTRDRPSISIGYNKAVADSVFVDEVEKRGVDIIRRSSGGSAIYTDQGQLIFSVILSDSLLSSDIVESYSEVCGAVVSALSALGIRAEHKPVNDILVDGMKISGSAQLRRGGAVLHHGTLLVDTDVSAIPSIIRPADGGKGSRKLTCLRSLLGASPGMQPVKDAIAEGFMGAFDADIMPGRLTSDEESEIRKLIEEKYGSRSWNYRL